MSIKSACLKRRHISRNKFLMISKLVASLLLSKILSSRDLVYQKNIFKKADLSVAERFAFISPLKSKFCLGCSLFLLDYLLGDRKTEIYFVHQMKSCFPLMTESKSTVIKSKLQKVAKWCLIVYDPHFKSVISGPSTACRNLIIHWYRLTERLWLRKARKINNCIFPAFKSKWNYRFFSVDDHPYKVFSIRTKFNPFQSENIF